MLLPVFEQKNPFADKSPEREGWSATSTKKLEAGKDFACGDGRGFPRAFPKAERNLLFPPKIEPPALLRRMEVGGRERSAGMFLFFLLMDPRHGKALQDPAIDDDFSPGRIAGSVGSEIDRRAGDFIGFSDSSDGG